MLSIVTPADSFDLTTLPRVKAELGIDNQAEDENLARWITAASDIVSGHCKRVFAAQTYQETFRLAEWRDALLLSRYPVTAITSIVENDATLDPGDAEVHSDNGTLIRLIGDRPAWWSRGKIVVTYTAGFADADALPAAIEQAAIKVTTMLRHAASRDPLVKSTSVPGVLDQTFWVGGIGDDGLPPDVRALLTPHRDRRVR